MANKGKIDEWIDEPAVKKQYDLMVKYVEDIVNRISSIKKVEINLSGASTITDTSNAIKSLATEQQKLTETEKQLHTAHEKLVTDAKNIIASTAQAEQILKNYGGTLEQNVKLQISNKVAIDQLKNSQKDLAKQFEAGRISASAYAAKSAEIVQQQEELKIANAELTQSIKATIKGDQAAIGSIDERAQRLGRLKDLYRQLSEEERTNVEVGGQLLAVIQEEDAQVKALNGSLGNFQGNVGNYPKVAMNFSTALEIMKGQLAEVTKNLEAYQSAGDGDADTIAQLTRQQDILNKLVNSAASGYASATAELKANEKALQALAAAGLENTDAYRELLDTTSELKDSVGDLRAELTAKASDTSFLDGLIDGAQGLAGAYGAAQGAASLFGVENEELDAQLVKIQSAMAIVSGLQEVQNLLQKESAFRIAIATGLQKLQTLSTNLQAAAESRSIVVRYAAIAAQKALNAVMTVNPILAVIGALALLLVSMTAFASSTQDATQAQNDFNNSMEISISLANSMSDAIGKANEVIIAQLEAQGATAKRIREEAMKGLKQQIAEQQRLEDQNQAAYNKATERIKQLAKTGKKKDQEEFEELEKTRKAFEDIQKKKYDLQQKLELQQQNDAKETRKEGEATQRDLLEAQKSRTASAIDANNRIAESDKYSADVRVAAIKKSEAAQIQQVKLSKAQQLTDITLSATERSVIEAKSQDDIIKIQRDANDKIRQIQQQRVEIQRQAGFDQVKRDMEAQIAGFEEVADREKASTADRLQALGEAQAKRQQLILGTRNFELKQDLISAEEQKKGRKLTDNEILFITGQTAAQRVNIQNEADKQLNDALIAYYKAKGAIIQQGEDKELATLETNGQSALATLNKQRDERLAVLDAQFAAGGMKQKKYDEERKKIDDRFQQAALLNEINFTEQQVKLLEARGLDTADAEAKIAAARAAIYKLDADNHKASVDKKLEQEKELRDKAIEATKEVYGAVFSILTNSIEKQKNQIQEQIDLIDQRKEKEIDAINQSALSEQEKADKISVLNAKSQAQKEALQRQQRKLDQEKARFDRMKAIADIITNTAVAITGYIGGLPFTAPLIALAGAMGAAQLAVTLSQPIPKYKHGRSGGPAEWAYTGDGGVNEVIELPSGKAYLTPDTDTLTYLPTQAKVHPSFEAYEDAIGQRWNVRRHLPAEDAGAVGAAALFAQLQKSQEKQTQKLLTGLEKNKATMMVVSDWSGVRSSLENASGKINYLGQNVFGR